MAAIASLQMGAMPPAATMNISRLLNWTRFEALIRKIDSNASTMTTSVIFAAPRIAEDVAAMPVTTHAKVIAQASGLKMEMKFRGVLRNWRRATITSGYNGQNAVNKCGVCD